MKQQIGVFLTCMVVCVAAVLGSCGERSARGAKGMERHSGDIVETVDAPPYRFLRLKTKNGECWAAVPIGTLVEGRSVTVANAIAVRNFPVATLHRSLDVVYFGSVEQK